MAFTFKKPLLIHEAFNSIDDFVGTSVFYNTDNLAEILTSLSYKKKQIQELSANFISKTKFSLSFQKQKITQFLD
jgi:hypothetical protein